MIMDMKRVLLLAAVMVGSTQIFGYSANADEGIEREMPRSAVKKPEVKDFEIKPKGRIRQDAFYYNKPTLFGTDPEDENWYMRSRIDCGLEANHGKKTFGDAATEMAINFRAYNFWQSNNAYDRFEPVTVRSAALDNAVTGDSHSHTLLFPRVFLEQGWVKFNFGVLVDRLEDHPISVTVGYFPYEIGRGVALGLHEDLANTTIGWGGEFGATRFPMMPPGVLIRGAVSKNFTWDIYYNKWRATNGISASVAAPVYQNRLHWPTNLRGKDKDRATFAVRADLKTKAQGGDLAFQPYAMYTDAPELPIEFEADSKAWLGTVGMMTDWQHPRVNFNVEMAGQFGKHEIFSFDRNQVSLARDINGAVKEEYTHIRLTNGETGIPAPVTDAVRAAANLPVNRTADRNGQPLLVAPGGRAVQAPNRNGVMFDVFNSSLWGQPRIREAFKVNYGGLMGLVDAAYKFEDAPLKAAVAAGYIGGDAYPFNTENGEGVNALQPNQGKNKTYKGFIAQRAAYVGKEIHSFYVFDRQVLQRPTSFINQLMFADNNFRDYSNLMFVGSNVVWYPLQDKKKLTVEPNVISFWEASAPYKWDKNGRHPNDRYRALLTANNGGVSPGWLSDKKASAHLGVELNVVMNYEIVKGCTLYFKGWIFKPGQLYRDIEGQPNRVGRRRSREGVTSFYQFGADSTVGFYTGFDYKF